MSISSIPVFFFFFVWFLDPIKSHTQICPGTMGSLLFSLIDVGLRTQCILLFLSSRQPANQRLEHENPNPAARVLSAQFLPLLSPCRIQWQNRRPKLLLQEDEVYHRIGQI
ncbi:hypothetical protein CsatB_014025 [Cannabis sativa]